MKRKCVNWALLGALIVIGAMGDKWVSTAAFSAQTAKAGGRSLPIFEVDHGGPKVPLCAVIRLY